MIEIVEWSVMSGWHRESVVWCGVGAQGARPGVAGGRAGVYRVSIDNNLPVNLLSINFNNNFNK